jgi:hypothetical protein
MLGECKKENQWVTKQFQVNSTNYTIKLTITYLGIQVGQS